MRTFYSISQREIWPLFLTAALLLFALPAGYADDLPELLRLTTDFNTKMLVKDFAAAERAATELVAFAEKNYRDDAAVRIIASCSATAAFDLQGKHLQAEPHMHRALFLLDYLPSADGEPVLPSLQVLALAYSGQKRYAQAERVYKKLAAITEQLYGPRDKRVAGHLVFLGVCAQQQGRLADAEAWYRQALAIHSGGSSRVDLAMVEMNMAFVCLAQQRLVECEHWARHVVQISEGFAGLEAPLVGGLDALALVAEQQGKFASAEPLLQRALKITETMQLMEKPAFLAAKKENLARLHRLDKQFAKAAQELTAILSELEREYGPKHHHLTSPLTELSRLREDEGKLDEANALLDRANSIAEETGGVSFEALLQRAKLARRRNASEEMVAALNQAVDLAEAQRIQSSGNEADRARYFSGFSAAYEMLIAHDIAQGETARALAIAERSRARSLLDQMHSRGIDWLAGVNPQTAQELRWKENIVQVQLATLQSRWNELGTGRESEKAALAQQLQGARRAVIEASRDIRNSSPAYRLAIGKSQEPASLQAVTDWCAKQNSALLYFWIGEEQGYLLMAAPGLSPKWISLSLTKEQAELLGTTAGPLTRARLAHVLVNRERSGVAQLIRSSQPGEQLVPRLAALYDVLIPPALREQFESGELKALAIVPDGGLEIIPLGALVVRSASPPEYLIDVAPPVLYAPTVTFLLSQTGSADEKPELPGRVLTVGDVDYASFRLGSAPGPSEAASPRAHYAIARGGFAPLPYTGWETTWVSDVLGKKRGLTVESLTKGAATEDAIRKRSQGCGIVHLACHGLADQAHGNAFGALVVVPGPSGGDLRNDGFLSLAEIYEWDLQNCELAILSACETNFGPREQGEGVFAISRGFLVAGSRRVVASNWLIDDEAGATLISYYCRNLAEAGAGELDYALALRDASLAVKKQEKWSSPFYWAPFVLVGPR